MIYLILNIIPKILSLYYIIYIMSFLTIEQFNQLLDVRYDNNVIYISGAIKGPLTGWSSTLHGYLIGTVPSAFKPDKRLIFMIQSDDILRLDITPTGHV